MHQQDQKEIFQLNTPVAYCFFNRPKIVNETFPLIRALRPKLLFLIADAPRPEHVDDVDKCEECKCIIESHIDWPCKVYKNYSDHNMGCRLRMSSGITWVFEQVEEAIILEDDCKPSLSFFRFCQELLDQYRNNDRVMMISGYAGEIRYRGSESYFFSHFTPIWGWATWRRAWKQFSFDFSDFSSCKRIETYKNILPYNEVEITLESIFKQYSQGRIDSWAYPWLFSIIRIQGLSVIPRENLVHNIGFGEDATHTTDIHSQAPKAKELVFPLAHPKVIKLNKNLDWAVFKSCYKRGFFQKVRRRLNLIIFKLKKVFTHIGH